MLAISMLMQPKILLRSAVYITFVQITHQIHVLTEPLCPAWGIFNLLRNNERRTK